MASRMRFRLSPAVVFDDDAGAGGEVGLEVGVGAAGVAGGDVQPAVVEPLRASGLLSTRNSTSKLGSRISSSILMSQLVWQTARHLIVTRRLPGRHPSGICLRSGIIRPLPAGAAMSQYRPDHGRMPAQSGIVTGSPSWPRLRCAAPRASSRRSEPRPTWSSFGVTVTDRAGDLSTDLAPGRLRGARGRRAAGGVATSPAATRRGASAPELHLGLLFDTSGSMEDDIGLARIGRRSRSSTR